MTIVLGILKILGFIVLGIICLVLFIVIFSLHVPVRYKADVKINDKNVLVKYSFSWFLHFVYVSGCHGDVGHLARLRIFGIPVKTYKSRKAQETESNPENRDKTSIKNKLLNIVTKFLELRDKYSNASSAYKHIIKEIVGLLQKYKPKKARGHVCFGFEDPSITGMLLGLYYAVYPVSPEQFQVTGNFDGSYLDADFAIKGEMHFRSLLAAFIRLYNDKDVLRIFKDREKKHGRK